MSNDFNSPNPYQVSPVSPTMSPSGDSGKPTSMIVFGILNLVFGALGLLVFAAVIGAMFMDLPKDPNNPMQQAMEDPTYKVLNIVSQVIGVGLTLVLLISGIGLINGHLYGRRLAIVYGIGALFVALVGSLINIVYVALPTLSAANEMPDGPEKVGAIIGASSLFVSPICGMIYPVILLIFMMRAPIKRYFKI